MAYIIEVKVNQSELTEAIQEFLANGWNICGLKVAGEITMRTLLLPICPRRVTNHHYSVALDSVGRAAGNHWPGLFPRKNRMNGH